MPNSVEEILQAFADGERVIVTADENRASSAHRCSVMQGEQVVRFAAPPAMA